MAETIDSYIKSGPNKPTEYTPGTKGQFYKETTHHIFYVCTAVNGDGTYEWKLSMGNLYYERDEE